MAVNVYLSEIAKMGYVGFANVFGVPLRISSCNVGLKQDIIPSDMIDGSADKVIYRQSAHAVEGEIVFPLIVDNAFTMLNIIWILVTNRDRLTGEVKDGDIIIKYAQANPRGEGGTYRFKNCKIQSFSLSLGQGEAVVANMTVWGKDRDYEGNTSSLDFMKDFISGFQNIFSEFTQSFADMFNNAFSVSGANPVANMTAQVLGLSPAKMIVWSNVQVFGYSLTQGFDFSDPQALDNVFKSKRSPTSSSNTFPTQLVRNFTVNISNNLDKTYSFKKSIPKIDRITTGQRDVTGTIEFQGWAPTEQISPINSNKKFSDQVIEMRISSDCGGVSALASSFANMNSDSNNEFIRRFFGVTYQLQDISTTMGTLVSTANWRAHGVPQQVEGKPTYIALDVREPILSIFDL